jgi:mannose-6-phosphate isomerase-like protein (cupin superfamily)
VILTDTAGAGIAASVSDTTVRWSCLARRGMLYSECEAIDHLELAPSAAVTMAGRHGIEEAWFVLDGNVELGGGESPPPRAARGDLVLRPAGTPATVRNPSAEAPARLLLIAVLPPAVTDRLPRRRPALDRADAATAQHEAEAAA